MTVNITGPMVSVKTMQLIAALMNTDIYTTIEVSINPAEELLMAAAIATAINTAIYVDIYLVIILH